MFIYEKNVSMRERMDEKWGWKSGKEKRINENKILKVKTMSGDSEKKYSEDHI